MTGASDLATPVPVRMNVCSTGTWADEDEMLSCVTGTRYPLDSACAVNLGKEKANCCARDDLLTKAIRLNDISITSAFLLGEPHVGAHTILQLWA
ncbi:MAG: hypothetical protein FWD55_07175 [Propionibacteriaceae bacterium]|nr:hypothetical protein [Propionibacteriaceae bacterium]